MMAQSGLPIPLRQPAFPSSPRSLPTSATPNPLRQRFHLFRAHHQSRPPLTLAGNQSLVLLDELGSSTDPEEGSALAVAIASHFLTAGAWSLISTHHTSLKVYAPTPRRAQRRCGVDESPSRPTISFASVCPALGWHSASRAPRPQLDHRRRRQAEVRFAAGRYRPLP